MRRHTMKQLTITIACTVLGSHLLLWLRWLTRERESCYCDYVRTGVALSHLAFKPVITRQALVDWCDY